MCGIAGAFLPHVDPADRWEIAQRLLLAAQGRGEDAAGIGYHKDGKPVVVKAGTSAVKFVQSEAFGDLKEDISDNFVLHARKTTQGHEKDNLNNHPLTSKESGAILVHNGTVYDEDWRATDENGDNPYMWGSFDGSVDTESILRLVETMRFIPREENLSVDPEKVAVIPKKDWKVGVSWMKAIDDAMYNMRGSFACALLPPEEPNRVYLWCHDKPLYVAYVEEFQGIVWGSTQGIVEAGLTETETKWIYNYFPAHEEWVLDYAGKLLSNNRLLRVDYAPERNVFAFKEVDIDPPSYTKKRINVSQGGTNMRHVGVANAGNRNVPV